GAPPGAPWPPALGAERPGYYAQARLELLRRRDATELHSMPAPISTRAARLTPSATLAVLAPTREPRAVGKRVLNFSAGEPDFSPPGAVSRAVVEAAQAGPVL